jgi:hypothetical protein
MQGMIHHHNQALQMAAMIPTHTKTPQLHSMGQRITISQSGDIKWMTAWLTARKQEVPMIHGGRLGDDEPRGHGRHAGHAHGRADESARRRARRESLMSSS